LLSSAVREAQEKGSVYPFPTLASPCKKFKAETRSLSLYHFSPGFRFAPSWAVLYGDMKATTEMPIRQPKPWKEIRTASKLDLFSYIQPHRQYQPQNHQTSAPGCAASHAEGFTKLRTRGREPAGDLSAPVCQLTVGTNFESHFTLEYISEQRSPCSQRQKQPRRPLSTADHATNEYSSCFWKEIFVITYVKL
jgi:hypothetical protein